MLAEGSSNMNVRTRKQLAEALGSVNRWYCSQAYGCTVTDPETLLRYFIKNGGAHDFAVRYEQAMGAVNRWYCSEFYSREINDPDILWNYYTTYGGGSARTIPPQSQPADHCAELSFA
jgi:hypothetical protein